MKESTRVLVALGAGVAGGTAIAASGNESLLRAADLLAPVGALWVNAIRMTVIPLVVSLLITGVASATDLKSIGRLGGRTVLVGRPRGRPPAPVSPLPRTAGCTPCGRR